MVSRNRRSIGLFCVALNALTYSLVQADQRFGRATCGPQCVAFVLSYYQRPGSECRNLIQECGVERDDNGSTMADLDRALRGRNIGTCLSYYESSDLIHWQYPVIVHLEQSGSDCGHFVVLYQSGKRPTWWDPAQGRLNKLPPKYRLTGYAIFTCPDSYIEPDLCDLCRIMSIVAIPLVVVTFIGRMRRCYRTGR